MKFAGFWLLIWRAAISGVWGLLGWDSYLGLGDWDWDWMAYLVGFHVCSEANV
jgi:hypothetical protein